MRLTLLLLISFVLLAPIASALEYSDDFEDDTPPNPPEDDWYEFVSTGNGQARTSSAIKLGTASFLFDDTDAAVQLLTEWDMGILGVDICQSTGFGAELSFAIRFSDFGTASSVQLGFSKEIIDGEPGSGLELGYVVIDNAGAVSVKAGASTTASFATLSLATWYNITLFVLSTADPTCDTSGTIFSRAYIQELDTSGQTSGAIGGVAGDYPGELIRVMGVLATNVATFNLDNLEVRNVNPPPPEAVGSSATAAVTDLVGFDVDSTGSGLIARVDGGDDITSYAPTTLTSLGTREVDCNGVGNQNNDMVASSDFANLYVVCDSGTNNPAFFSIRSYNEATVTIPGCSASDCIDDIDLRGSGECTGDDEFPDDLELREINDVASVPLDYSFRTGSGALDSFAIAVAYSADNGNVGIVQYTAVNTGDDRCKTVSRAFAGSTPEQISVWQPDPDEDQVYLAAVDSGGSNRYYVYTPVFTGSPQRLEGTMTTGAELGGTTGGVSVSCDNLYCLVITTDAIDNVRLIQVQTGSTVWKKTATSEVVRGGALAIAGSLGGDNDFAIYLDGSTAYVVYANNGTAFGSITLPSGTFKEIRLKDGASSAWIATSTTIAYYNLLAAFPDIIPTGCENPPCDADQDGGSDGLFMPPSGPGTPFSNSDQAGWFSAILMIVGMTVTLGASPSAFQGARSRGFYFSVWLAIIGAVLGFVLAITFGLLSTAMWVSMVILAAVGIGIKVWVSRSGGM